MFISDEAKVLSDLHKGVCNDKQTNIAVVENGREMMNIYEFMPASTSVS